MSSFIISNNKYEIERQFKKLREEDFDVKGWITDNVFHAYIKISEGLQTLLDCNCDFMSAEYQIDENKFMYVIYRIGEDEEVEDLLIINEKVNCSFLNSLFDKIIRNFTNDGKLKNLLVDQDENTREMNKIEVRIISKSGNTYKGKIEGLNLTSVVLDGKNAIKLNNNSYILTDSIEFIEII